MTGEKAGGCGSLINLAKSEFKVEMGEIISVWPGEERGQPSPAHLRGKGEGVR